MAYQSGDDPRLLSDLKSALRRWHRPTLGDAALAHRLADVDRRLAADPGLVRADALRQTLRAAVTSLQDDGRTEWVDLLKRHHFHNETAIVMAEALHLSERSIYHRLQEAHIALAYALWAQEPAEAKAASSSTGHASRTLFKTRNLPPKTATQLFGVDEMLAHLLEYLEDRDRHWVISLEGMAGLGKTALAREAAGRLAATDRFADIAWVTINPGAYSSRGPTPSPPALSLACPQVLSAIIHQLRDIDLDPTDLASSRDQVRELLQSDAYLVVLDNLEMALDCGALPDWFWDLANPSKFLLTSRHWLEADVEAAALSLNQLVEADGQALIRHEVRLRGHPLTGGADEDILHRILAVTGGNPLAIKLVVGQATSLPLNRILLDLETVQPGTKAFYQHLYGVSWDLISAPARHVLLQMARLPATGGTWEDVSAIAGLSGDGLDHAIEALAAHSLLQVSGFEEKTYSLHPLTYHFAINQANQRPDT